MATATLEVSRVLAVLDADDVLARFAELARICGWNHVDVSTLEDSPVPALDDRDLAAARRWGGTIKRVLWATCDGDRIEAFAGPALVPVANALASVDRKLDAVQFSGRYRHDLSSSVASPVKRAVVAPLTEWLVRARFPGVTPHLEASSPLFDRLGLHTIAACADAHTHWRRVAAAPRERIERAIAELRTRHRMTVAAIRAL